MGVYAYPQEVHEFVKRWAPELRDQELAAACNEKFGTEFTASKMKNFRGNHGYRNCKKQWTSEEYWKYQKRWPQGMYEFIRDNSWGVSSKDMAEMVNEKFGTSFTPTMIKQFRQRQGIKSGVTGWFRKGRSPGNKGKKLEEYIDDPDRVAEIKRRISATQFKKGERPVNELHVGDIVVNSYGYKLIKVQMEGKLWDRWKFLHRHVWEEHNDPIPKGMVVTFKDSDKLNCDIDNLMLVTKGENAVLSRKHYRFSDPDLTGAVLGLVRLEQAIGKKRKEKRKEKEKGKSKSRRKKGGTV